MSATDDLVLRALAWGLKKETTRSELAWWLRRELGAEDAEARWPALVRGLREGGHWAPDVDASSHALRVTRERGASKQPCRFYKSFTNYFYLFFCYFKKDLAKVLHLDLLGIEDIT